MYYFSVWTIRESEAFPTLNILDWSASLVVVRFSKVDSVSRQVVVGLLSLSSLLSLFSPALLCVLLLLLLPADFDLSAATKHHRHHHFVVNVLASPQPAAFACNPSYCIPIRLSNHTTADNPRLCLLSSA